MVVHRLYSASFRPDNIFMEGFVSQQFVTHENGSSKMTGVQHDDNPDVIVRFLQDVTRQLADITATVYYFL